MFAKFKLICLGALFFSCTNDEYSPSERVVIDDSNFELINGVLNYGGNSFSGYVFNTYPNGGLKSEIQYLKGRKHGYEKHWFSNDSLSILRYYNNGTKTGVHKSWWNNGQLKFMYHFNDNGMYNGSITEWYADGQLAKQFNFIDGKENGSQKLFKNNGSIKANYVVVNEERYGLIGLKKCYTVTTGKNEIQ